MLLLCPMWLLVLLAVVGAMVELDLFSRQGLGQQTIAVEALWWEIHVWLRCGYTRAG